MKKILSIVLMILVVVSPVLVDAKPTTTKSTKTTVTKKSTKKTTTKKTTTKEKSEEKDPINVYVFYWSTCPHCADLHNFLNKLKEDKTYGSMFKVVDYEVKSSEENAELMDKVAVAFNEENDGSVPVYVIGDQYFSGFSEDGYGDKVKQAIKKSYENQTEDKVTKLIEELKNKKDSNILGYIVLAVVAVIIIGVIYSSSKNKYYDDENSSEEVEEENLEETSKEETKETPKKTAAKKTSSTAKKTTKKKTTKKQVK